VSGESVLVLCAGPGSPAEVDALRGRAPEADVRAIVESCIHADVH